MSDEYETFTDEVPVMRSAIRHSEKVDKILPAMLAAQKAIEHAVKDAENPHFHSSYASLNALIDAVKPAYNNENVVIVQGAITTPDAWVEMATRFIECSSGQWYETSFGLTATNSQAHAMTGGSTYCSRYGLRALAFVGAEDDDGNAAQGKKKPTQKTGTQKQKTKEVGEEQAKTEAERGFFAEWSRVMNTAGEHDPDNQTALRRHFLKITTEKSDKFLMMSDSLAGRSSKEIKSLTAMLKKGHEHVANLCAGQWRKYLNLDVTVCATEGCDKVLTPEEKEKCSIVGLDTFHCEEHAGDAKVIQMTKAKLGGNDE